MAGLGILGFIIFIIYVIKDAAELTIRQVVGIIGI